ncbi:MAG: orange carotenoid protein N-terminal domain-containing protein [Thainema sp.]
MTASANKNTFLPEGTQKVVDAFESLGTDEKLALLYYAYEHMGESITPAAPSAANPELVPTLIGDYLELSDDEQLQIMREIVEGKDSDCSRAYGGLTENNQLLVWYAWAKEMGNNVVDMPADYKASSAIKDALKRIENLEFQEQISMLRTIAGNMGYSEVGDIPSQKETGKTPSL